MAQTRAESIADGLRTALRQGIYLCGERLVELSLAKELDVSQNTIRDALYQLEGEGWVVKRARYGVFVRSFTREQAEEVFELLGALEPLALQILLREGTRRALAPLAELAVEARRAASLGQWQAAIERLFQFHEALGQRPQRPTTADLIHQFYNQVRLLEALRQARAPRNPRELDATVTRHETLMRHLTAGEGEAARALLTEQVQNYTALILGTLTL